MSTALTIELLGFAEPRVNPRNGTITVPARVQGQMVHFVATPGVWRELNNSLATATATVGRPRRGRLPAPGGCDRTIKPLAPADAGGIDPDLQEALEALRPHLTSHDSRNPERVLAWRRVYDLWAPSFALPTPWAIVRYFAPDHFPAVHRWFAKFRREDAAAGIKAPVLKPKGAIL